MRAIICPVCHGKGQVVMPNNGGESGSKFRIQTCQCCWGRGSIVVQDNQPYNGVSYQLPLPMINS